MPETNDGDAAGVSLGELDKTGELDEIGRLDESACWMRKASGSDGW